MVIRNQRAAAADKFLPRRVSRSSCRTSSRKADGSVHEEDYSPFRRDGAVASALPDQLGDNRVLSPLIEVPETASADFLIYLFSMGDLYYPYRQFVVLN